jgi:hypothetical protein
MDFMQANFLSIKIQYNENEEPLQLSVCSWIVSIDAEQLSFSYIFPLGTRAAGLHFEYGRYASKTF